MKTTKLITVAFIFASYSIGCAQFIVDDEPNPPILAELNFYKQHCAIYYNYIANLEHRPDTIEVIEDSDTLRLFFQDDELLYSSNGFGSALLSIGFSPVQEQIKIYAFTQLPDSTQWNMFYSKVLSRDNTTDWIFTSYHERHGQPIDEYREYFYDGSLKEEGQYIQVDSTWQETVYGFDPETGKGLQFERTHEVFAKPSGTWKFYSKSGHLLKVEEY